METKLQELIQVIKSVYVETGFAPSMSDTAEMIGMTKGGAISAMFKELEANGAIIYSPNRKSYIPSDWRALSTPPDIEQKILLEAKKDFHKEVARAVTRRIKAIENGEPDPDLEKVRAQNRLRQRAWRQNKRGKGDVT